MAIKINFDTANVPEVPTFVLCRRSGERFGAINNFDETIVGDNMNSAAEITLTVHKYLDGKECTLWDEIKDFRLIYVEEWDRYFELYVNIDESTEVTKEISLTSLPEAELSQINAYDIEINTEDDIARDDYTVTVLYDPDNPKASLLDRLLVDKARHYVIHHVDDTIASIQRTFSFNDKSLYDCFQEIAEEIGCVFIFGEADERSPMHRTISVYDLESNCKECGYRGEYTGVCPKCGCTDILEGYGEDTTIFLSADNLTDDIGYSTDINSVKNCFRLEAGDDLMTATVKNANPANSQYLWYITDETKKDMSERLVERLEEYDTLYAYYQSDFVAEIPDDIIEAYNALVEKYLVYDEDLLYIDPPIIGYTELMTIYYETIDFYGFLYTDLMPPVDISGRTAEEQAALLTEENLSPVGVQSNMDYISNATADSTVLAAAKVLVDTARFKVKVGNSTYDNIEHIWTGYFIVTNYYDDDDYCESAIINIQFDTDYELYIRQQLEKALANADENDLSITALFAKDEEDFKAELQKYSYVYLQTLYTACQACLNIMIEEGITDSSDWSYTEGNVYEDLYVPYYEKNALIEEEIVLRESEINLIIGTYDEYGDVVDMGLQNYIDDIRVDVGEILDFETYLGDDWDEFCSFRREQTWSNENYISDGLTNVQLFENAENFIDAASKELYKSATLQHIITSTLKNLLILPQFQPIVKYFEVGNWLRIEIDDKIYKLRLLGYQINYDNLDTLLTVEFSDVVEGLGVVSDIKSVLDQAKSMASSYSSVAKQSVVNNEATTVVNNIIQNGLNTATTEIVGGTNQNIVWDGNGLLFRKYDDITGQYLDTQIKIINSMLALTDDNWKTSKVGVGQFSYTNPKTGVVEAGYGIIANQLIGDLILSEEIGIYNEDGTMTFDSDGLMITNGTNTFIVNPNSDNMIEILNGDEPVLQASQTGELSIVGNFTAKSLTLDDADITVGNDVNTAKLGGDTIFILTKNEEPTLYFDDSGDLNFVGNAEINKGSIVNADITTADIATANITRENTTTANITTANITTADVSTESVSDLTVKNCGIKVTNSDGDTILTTNSDKYINVQDVWGDLSNVVTSTRNYQIKLDWDGEKINVYVGRNLYATI